VLVLRDFNNFACIFVACQQLVCFALQSLVLAIAGLSVSLSIPLVVSLWWFPEGMVAYIFMVII